METLTGLVLLVQAHAHEGIVGDFYASWMRPYASMGQPRRTISCCHQKDCHAAEVKRGVEGWSFKGPQGNWISIPEERLENNQPDPRDSPDGLSHVCYTGWVVVCAILGGQL